MLDNGVAMADIDRMEYGLYMEILRERAARRGRKAEGAARQPNGKEEKIVELRRGFIDDVM